MFDNVVCSILKKKFVLQIQTDEMWGYGRYIYYFFFYLLIVLSFWQLLNLIQQRIIVYYMYFVFGRDQMKLQLSKTGFGVRERDFFFKSGFDRWVLSSSFRIFFQNIKILYLIFKKYTKTLFYDICFSFERICRTNFDILIDADPQVREMY